MFKKNDRKNSYLIIFFSFIVIPFAIKAQTTIIKGAIIDSYSIEPVSFVEVSILSSTFTILSNSEGTFILSDENLPIGEQIMIFRKDGYLSQKIRLTIERSKSNDLGIILLEIDLSKIEAQIGTISISDDQIDNDLESSYNISGLLHASKDVFLNAAAFDFSATYFRPRGLGSSYGKVLINGVEMNKQLNGRPQWANWGGLNDAQRQRVFSMGLRANDYAFGDLAGLTNITMRASNYRRGGGVSYAMANRSYQGRVMASYNSGLSLSGWAYSILISRRFGNKGSKEGTVYDANSFFAAVEKKLDESHSMNLAIIYTPNRRGRSTAITKEEEILKGPNYNPNWGFQEGKIRSSRILKVVEPIIMLNHYWQISQRTTLNTNIGVQKGSVESGRLDSAGRRNPAGNYYQRLPSYFLRFENPSSYDYELAYLAEQEFINDGQLDWNTLYQGNVEASNGLSIYTVQSDKIDDTQITFNSILTTWLSDNVFFNGSLNYRSLKSENYAQMNDLLGGMGYLDIDYFGESNESSNSDIQNPNRIINTGDRFKYNYIINANVISGFAQVQFKYRSMDFFMALGASQTSYRRNGLYQNGYFPEDNRSLGKGEKISFSNIGFKGGLTYKVTGRHLVEINVGYFTKAPTIRNSFANVRQNNDLIHGLVEEKLSSLDLSYNYRSPLVKARVSGFYSGFQDQTDIGFFFTQNALGNDENNAFVQEVVTGIDKRNVGIEAGVEVQLLPAFKLKAAASVGQIMYTNNPNLYLAGDDFDDLNTPETREGNDLYKLGLREVSLRNYHAASGPERAYQVGFEYRDPNFWWMGSTVNYYSNAYIDISNLRRTPDFYTDIDGLPFTDYDEETAKSLLAQEELDDYFLVNLVGGKSWKIKKYYFGFFAAISNILNQEYIISGFENSRRSSYRQQLEEQTREYGPLFGNRYFFGNGTTYYMNVYVRF
jgi:hypothetical protein